MPLLWLSLSFIAGIALAARVPQSASLWLALAGASLAALAVSFLLRHFRIRVALPQLPLPFPVLLIVFFLGAARYQSVQPEITSGFIAWYNDSKTTVRIEGLIVRTPQRSGQFDRLNVQAERLGAANSQEMAPVKGMLLVTTISGVDWRYGDRIRVQGKLETPSQAEDFSFRDYLARKGIYSELFAGGAVLLQRDQGNRVLAAIYSLQQRFIQITYRLFPDPEASLLAGILFGDDSGLSQRVQSAFKVTGTAHIIAISGFNISIIAGLFTWLFSRLLGTRRRWQVAGLSLSCILLYTLLVGAGASVVRAAIMGSLGLLGAQLGRRQDGLNSLAFTGAVMCLISPQLPWDVSFQLSFLATLGMVLYAEPIKRLLTRLVSRLPSRFAIQHLVDFISEYFLLTLAAQVFTVPLMAYYFHQVSLVSLVANPVVLPVQPALMLLSGMSALTGLVFLPLGQFLADLAWPAAAFTIRSVEFFAAWPFASQAVGNLPPISLACVYGLVLLLTFKLDWLKRRAGPAGLAIPLTGLVFITALTWRSIAVAPDGRLHVTLLDVGKGNAILIRTPIGRNVLINGGPSASLLSDGLGRRLGWNDRRLDWLVLTTDDKAQRSALASIIARFPPAQVMWMGSGPEQPGALPLTQALVDAQVPVYPSGTGRVLDLSAGARLNVIMSGKGGTWMLVEWKDFRVLVLTGEDGSAWSQLENGKVVGRVTAVVLESGDAVERFPSGWVANLSPQMVLVSAEAGEAGRLVEPLQGVQVLRTDLNGWIHLTTDGEQMWVEVERR